jgi:subtilase family serine protease
MICSQGQNRFHTQFINYFAASFAVALISIQTPAQSLPARQVLEGHVPPALARLHLQPIDKLSTTNRLNLAIGLPLRNQNSIDELLAKIYDPASPNFRHYLTPDQFAEQFGPAEADYAAVMAFAKTNGLTVTGTCSDRTILNVSGSVAEIERVFHVMMRQYRHPRENRNFFAPDVDPSIDLPVPILHVSGLDNFVVPHPASLKIIPAARAPTIKPAYGTSPLGTFMGKDFRAAYVPGVSLNGSNQVVGLLELDGYYTNDITTYESIAGLPSVTLSNVSIGGTSGTPGNANNEVALDIEMAISMATNLSKVIVYEGPNPISNSDIVNLLDSMATNNVAKQISCSWIIGNDPNFDIKYVQFAVQGQSFFQASGDDGAYYSGSQSADDTNITLVGGTTLSTTGAGRSVCCGNSLERVCQR